MADLILREWDGKRIRIRDDRYVSLTDMAKAAGKLYGNWRKSDSVQSYLEVLARSIPIGIDVLIQTAATGKNSDRGTWGDIIMR